MLIEKSLFFEIRKLISFIYFAFIVKLNAWENIWYKALLHYLKQIFKMLCLFNFLIVKCSSIYAFNRKYQFVQMSFIKVNIYIVIRYFHF